MHGPLALVLAAGVVIACDAKPPSRDSVDGWPPGQPVQVGSCSFVLNRAHLWHSTQWQLEVDVTSENVGAEAVHCGAAVRATTDLDVLTEVGKGGGKRQPGVSEKFTLRAREADLTGMSTGPAEGAWVYVELSQGRWPMADTVGVHVSPERVRPP